MIDKLYNLVIHALTWFGVYVGIQITSRPEVKNG